MATSNDQYVGLITLPEETIDFIVSFADVHTLTQLSLTSKILHRITEPYLYREVDLVFHYKSLARPKEFLRTVAQAPCIAAQVKKLFMDYQKPIYLGHSELVHSIATRLPNLQFLIISDTMLRGSDKGVGGHRMFGVGGHCLCASDLSTTPGPAHSWSSLIRLTANFHNTHLAQLIPVF